MKHLPILQFFYRIFLLLLVTLGACNQNPTIKDDYLLQAEKSYREGNLEESMQLYTKAIEQKQSLDIAYSGRGKIFSSWRRFDEAIADYTASLSIVRSVDALSSRCLAYRIQHKFELAKKDCEEALQVDPQFSMAYVANALLYIEQGELDNARSVLQEAEENDIKSAELYYVMYEIENATGDINKALELINKAIELDDKQPLFYWSRAFVHYSQANLDEAKNDLKLVLEYAKPERDDELIFKANNLLKNLGE